MLLVDYARWRLQALGEPDLMHAHGREARRIAESAGDREALGMAIWSLGLGCWIEQRIPEALARMDELVELAAGDPRLGTETMGYSVLAFAHAIRGVLRAWSGSLAAADADTERAASIASEQTSLELSGFVHFMTAMAAEVRGDAAKTSAHARSMFAVRERVVNELIEVQAEVILGMAQLLERELGQAVEALERPVAKMQERRVSLMLEPLALDRLAEALLGTGDLVGAEKRAREAVEVARVHGIRMGSRGPLLLARIVARARGKSARAEVEQLLAESVAYIEETGTRAWIPLLHEARAELERACGDAAAEERELREAQRLHAAMGASGHAERLARELGP
jgi:tetratricopeptide (TPR) repeat protein